MTRKAGSGLDRIARSRLCAVVPLLLLAAPTPLPGQRLTAVEIDRVIRAEVDSGFSGVVLVAHGDLIVLRRGYGPDVVSRPTPSTRFRIASITKSFTAAAILILTNRRQLSLENSIARFFPRAPADKRDITLEQLLTHTAGLGASYSGGGIHDRAAAVRAILSHPLAYQPGHGYRYGDDDYELLAAVLEVVSGRSWEEVIRREVLVPLGLRHTGFECELSETAAWQRSSLCAGHRADWGHRGANGMWSTVDDLLTWARALHGGTISALRDIEVPHELVRHEGSLDVAYGYGVRLYVRDGRVVEAMHAGSGDDGHTAVVRELGSGLTIIVLSNAGRHAGTTWSSYVAMKILARGPRVNCQGGNVDACDARP